MNTLAGEPPAPTRGLPRASVRRPHLRALTGLRFVAASWVVLFHMCGDRCRDVLGPFAPLAGAGYAAVSLFFILSGFVLTYTYGASGAPLRTRDFLVARVARVYPVYLLGLLVALPDFVRWSVDTWAAGEGARAAGAAATNVLLIQAWFPDFVQRWNTPGWSLSCEALFYVLFPLLLPRLARLESGRLRAVGALAWAIPLLMLAAAAVASPTVRAATPASDGWLLGVLRFQPLVRLPEFVIGCLLGQLFLRRDDGESAKGWWAGAAAVAVWAVITFARVPYVLLHDIALAPLFALIIWVLASGRGVLAAVLSSRLAVVLGEASYALYILHEAVGGAVDRHWARIFPHSARGRLAFNLFCVALSVAVFHAFEEPARRAIRRRFSRARTA